MPESQLTVHGKRPIGMREPHAFGVEDRPSCPSCGAEMHLFRRSPEPVYHGYEVQMFSVRNATRKSPGVPIAGESHTHQPS